MRPVLKRHGCASSFWRSSVPTGGTAERQFVVRRVVSAFGVPEFQGVELKNASWRPARDCRLRGRGGVRGGGAGVARAGGGPVRHLGAHGRAAPPLAQVA